MIYSAAQDQEFVNKYGPIECDHCGRTLRPGKVEWLELSMADNTWHAGEGEIPEEDSQGMFPHGIACAKNILKQQALTL